MRVEVDFDRCDGNGLCAETAPEIFELGDDDLVRVRMEDLPAEQWTSAELAARACPKLAITLADGDL